MDSSLHSNPNEIQKSIDGSTNRPKDELKHVQQSVDLMKNRVLLLRQQLQKEKDAI